jgi:hypothetical protein
MTVTTTTTYNELAGTAGVFAYAFTFRCDDSSWVKVYLDDALQAAGYSVALNADQEASPGGTVTFVTAPDGLDVRIQRETPKTQLTNYTAYDAFPAASHEAALDKIVATIQDEARDRANGDAASAALVSAEAVARAAADALIIASGAAPANVGIAPVTPTGSVNLDTVANWLARLDVDGGPIPVIATDSTAARTLAGRFVSPINVLDYGADPSEDSDPAVNDAAFAAAIAAASGATSVGGAVYVPRGYYNISEPIVLTGSTALFGDGLGSEINQTSATANCIEITGNPSNVWLSRLFLVSEEDPYQGPWEGSSTGAGVHISSATTVAIDHVWSNCFGTGFYLHDVTELRLTNCVADQCLGDGYYVTGLPGPTGNNSSVLLGCITANCRGHGFRIETTWDLALIGCSVTNTYSGTGTGPREDIPGGSGYFLEGASQIRLIGCSALSTWEHGFSIGETTSCDRISLVGCHVNFAAPHKTASAYDGFYIDNTTNLTMAACQFDGDIGASAFRYGRNVTANSSNFCSVGGTYSYDNVVGGTGVSQYEMNVLRAGVDQMRIKTAKTPATAAAAGTAGDICWDSGYVYVCTATNTWKRAALTTW